MHLGKRTEGINCHHGVNALHMDQRNMWVVFASIRKPLVVGGEAGNKHRNLGGSLPTGGCGLTARKPKSEAKP